MLNIDELTLGQIKQLNGLFGPEEAKKQNNLYATHRTLCYLPEPQ